MSLSEVKKVHFIGIGGIGMSALARLFLHDKKEISGSDRAETKVTKELEKLGIKISYKQMPENIEDDMDLVVYTAAMPEDHPELEAAREKGIKTIQYFEALGLVANQYYLIAVSGTHGKTTTTAMLTDILEAAEFDPTAVIGSLRSKTKSNFRAGKSKYFIAEACEYGRHFLHLEPDVLVITNIEAEHLDYFKDVKDVQEAFRECAEKVRENGIIIANLSDKNVEKALKGIEKKIINYGKFIDPFLKLSQPGLHNQMNAAAAKAAAFSLGVEDDLAKQALEEFSGTWRRFEFKGEVNGAKVYDDYAHHPTEIKATIQGVRESFPSLRLITIFQPHLYSRTEELFDEFVDSLSAADHVIVTHVYDARDTGKKGATAEMLADAIKRRNENTAYIDSFEDIVEEVKATATENDIVLVMGAGDVTKVSGALTK